MTLKDAEGNSVPGQANLLNDTTVTIPNAEEDENETWKDNNDGTYTRTYTAKTVGKGLIATLQLADWLTARQSSTYVIAKHGCTIS